MQDKKTILITGVAGLIGSRLADWLIEKYPDLILPNKKLMESINNGTRYVFFCWKPYWDMLSGYYNIYQA